MGWGCCCLRELTVLFEAAAAATDSTAEIVAAVVQIDADVAVPRC